jgi:hypothetical protein
MAEGAIFLNSGPLFSGEQLESLEDRPEWTSLDAAARIAFERVKESFEKHSTLLAGNPSVEETRYHMVGPTLHALGFTHSAFEPLSVSGEQSTRVNYVCFKNAADFDEAVQSRGNVGFFRPALTSVRAIRWGQSFDAAPEATAEGVSELRPGIELDLLLRSTGLRYGILTNGCDWRVYHQASSGQLSTFFQADMIAAMKSDFEDFKRFYLLFNKSALVVDNKGRCFLDGLLA